MILNVNNIRFGGKTTNISNFCHNIRCDAKTVSNIHAIPIVHSKCILLCMWTVLKCIPLSLLTSFVLKVASMPLATAIVVVVEVTF